MQHLNVMWKGYSYIGYKFRTLRNVNFMVLCKQTQLHLRYPPLPENLIGYSGTWGMVLSTIV